MQQHQIDIYPSQLLEMGVFMTALMNGCNCIFVSLYIFPKVWEHDNLLRNNNRIMHIDLSNNTAVD